MVLDAHQNGTGNQLLQRLHKTLTEQYKQLKPAEDYVGILKAFTDNIVIGLPIYDDGESQLGGVFLDFASFQLVLTLENFFLRGGVAIGDYYGDDEFAYGPSIIEAHDLENKSAKFPRIILSDEAVQMVRQHVNYYFPPNSSPQARELLQDNRDGKWFINYLEAVMHDVYEYGDYRNTVKLLLQHKQIIEQNLILYQEIPHVHEKYTWVAQYHNHFCTENIPQYLLENSSLIITQNTNGNFSPIV